MRADSSYADAIERSGFAILSQALDAGLVSELCTAVESVKDGAGVRSRRGIYAIRNLLQLAPGVIRALDAPVVRGLVESVLGSGAFLVGGVFFDKTPGTRWNVPWHQNATIAVRERAEVTGFGPWSEKAGVVHVQAPPGVVAAMLSVRIYLDDCQEQHGALRVIPQSHCFGRLPTESIAEFTRGSRVEVCCVPRGGALAMRPLLLHSSFAGVEGTHRRVIHLDFAARQLPKPLEWYEAHRW